MARREFWFDNWAARVAAWLVVVLPVFASAGMALAIEPPPRRFALLVGVDYPKDIAGLERLPHAADEIRELYEALVNDLGWAREDIILIAGNAQTDRATRSRILDGLARLFNKVTNYERDTILIVLHGHGLQLKDQPFAFFPADGDLQNPHNAIILQNLYSAMQNDFRGVTIPTGRILLVISACRNDPGGTNLDFRKTFPRNSEQAPAQVSTLFACGEGQASYLDSNLRSVFLRLFSQAIRGAARSADQPKLTLEDVKKFLKAHTQKRVGDSKTRTQEPTWDEKSAAEIVFHENSPRLFVPENVKTIDAAPIIRNTVFEDVDFRRVNVEKKVFYRCHFRNCDFSGKSCSGTDFSFSVFDKCKLAKTDFQNARGLRYTRYIAISESDVSSIGWPQNSEGEKQYSLFIGPAK